MPGFGQPPVVHGNDYNEHKRRMTSLVTAIGTGYQGISTTRHLHTIETEADERRTYVASMDERWAPIVGLRRRDIVMARSYVTIFHDYNRKTEHRVPTFMIESSYEFEHLGGAQLGTPRQLRWEEYTSDLSGSTGQLYGNKYTWPFPPRLEGEAGHARRGADGVCDGAVRAAALV